MKIIKLLSALFLILNLIALFLLVIAYVGKYINVDQLREYGLYNLLVSAVCGIPHYKDILKFM